MKTCSLEKNPNGGGYTAASIEELRSFIKDQFGDIEWQAVYAKNYNMEVTRLIRQALHTIGDTYNNVYLKEITRQVEDIIQNDETYKAWWDGGYFPEQGIENTISKRNRQQAPGGPNLFEDDDIDTTSIKSAFLDRVYGNKAQLKNEIRQNAMHMLISDFIIDREAGEIVKNAAQANEKARKRKNQLFRSVLETLATDKDREAIDDFDTIVLYDENGKYTGVMENPDVRKVFYQRARFDIFNGKDIQDLYNRSLTGDDGGQYKAFKDFFMLFHYDDFTKLLLGEAVVIMPQTDNKFLNEDTYTFTDKTGSVITSWRPDNGQVDLKVEISALIQSLVNTTPYLKYGVTSQDGDKQLYLRFEDFYRVITKLKDAVYQKEASQQIEDTSVFGNAFYELTPDEQALVKGKTLGQIINSIRRNPQEYGRLAFRVIMASANEDRGIQTLKSLGFTDQDIDRFWSIYKGFFDGDTSLFNIQRKEDHNVRDYYATITQAMDSMFSVNYVQFYDDGRGNVVARTLKDQGSDGVRRNIENNITITHSRKIEKSSFEKLSIIPYKTKAIKEIDKGTLKETDRTIGVQYEIDGTTIKHQIVDGVISTVIEQGGRPLTKRELALWYKTDAVKKFIQKQICINITTDQNYIKALEAHDKNINPYEKLFEMANEIYFHRYLSNVEFDDNIAKTQATLSKLYGAATTHMPKMDYFLNEMQLTSAAFVDTMGMLARVYTMATGQATSATVRDSEGNLLSQQTLSRLLGSLPTQWEDIMAAMPSKYHKFSLFKDGMYTGHFTMKDFKSIVGNKAVTLFTPAEFMQATFLHSFVAGFVEDKTNKKIFANGKVGFLPSVNSDKNTIGLIRIDLNQECDRFRDSEGHFIMYKDLSIDQIEQLMCEELGDSYKMTWESIKEDYQRIQDYVNTLVASNPAYKGLIIDPDNNFAAFNLWTKEHGFKPEDLLYTLTRDYNLDHPMNPIKLIELVHYEKGPDGIQQNTTLRTLLDRYASRDKMKAFMNLKRGELFNDLIKSNFRVNLFNDEVQSDAANFLRDSSGLKNEWVHHGNMTIAKIRYNGKMYNIASKVDLLEFQSETGIDLLSDPHAVYSTPGVQFMLHPMLDKYNSLDYLFTQQFMIAGVGSHIAHPAKVKGDPIFEEAQRYKAQDKRNVSYTAAMHEYQLGQIDGIPTFYNMAMMKDVPAWVYTMAGDIKSDADSFDGATFVNPWVIEWENNSLKSSRAGVDKKPFVHFYDVRTHTGGIIKTAGFGVTNDRVRNSKFYRDMIFNMTHRPWFNEDGTPHLMQGNGILEDFNGNPMDYGPLYMYRDGKHYKREIKSFNAATQTYNIEETEVDDHGEAVGDTIPITSPRIDSNYRVWQMFGGHASEELVNGVLQLSEKSRELVAIAANNYGQRRNGYTGKIWNTEHVYQPMKHSDIHYMPTSGAVKQGAGNMNDYHMFFGKQMRPVPEGSPEGTEGFSNLNFMRVQMLQAGIQLDKEHHADNAKLSLMTQVVSAACAKGYMPKSSKKLYEALRELSKIGTQYFRDENGEIDIDDPEKFKKAAMRIILETVLNSSSSDGDMMVTIADDIRKKMLEKRDFSFSDDILSEALNIVPCSSPEIFRKVISSLSSSLTKSGIKADMPGTLSVLCPTHGIVKFYKVPDGKGGYKTTNYWGLEKMFGSDEKVIQKKLDELQAAEPIITNITDIELGYKYRVKTPEGYAIYKVVRPNKGPLIPSGVVTETTDEGTQNIPVYEVGYKDIKGQFETGEISEIQEYIKDGQDLKSYNVRFTVNAKDIEGNDIIDEATGKPKTISYQMADLDIVQDYFRIKELKGQERTNEIVRKIIQYGKFKELHGRLEKVFQKNCDAFTYEHDIKPSLDNFLANEANYAAGQDVFVFDNIKPILENYGLGCINRIMQQQLNAISKNSNDVEVIINGLKQKVNKESIKIQSYGCIMPKVFKSKFGLDEFDSVEQIKEDQDFFLKKLIKNASTKVADIPITDDDGKNIGYQVNYHMELKRADGKHIYIRNGLDGSTLENEVRPLLRKEGDKLYRVDGDNKIMYQLHYTKDAEGNDIVDKIYKDAEGNEIIVTNDAPPEFVNGKGETIPFSRVAYSDDNHSYIDTETKEAVTLVSNSGIQFYLDKFKYYTLNINHRADDATFTNIRNRASISKNASARTMYKLLSEGIKKKGKEASIANQKSEAAKLNDYNKVLDNKGDYLHLKEKADKMRTSFLRSLKIIAARIPAQSQQSFMSMEVLEFANPDANSAYVSIFQFFLQGSDLDIDAVSMQMFDINDEGMLEGHSPYYILDDETRRKASEDIPFPTGRNVVTQETDIPTLTTLYKLLNYKIGAKDSGALIEIYKEGINNRPPIIKLNLSNPLNIYLLSELIEDFNENGFIRTSEAANPEVRVNYNNYLFKGKQAGEMLLGKNNKNGDDIRYIEDYIINLVNRHNLYLKEASPELRKSIIKNYATTQLFNIIEDPINREQADSSVDVVTKPVKDLAKSSPKSTVQNVHTPGNVMNKFQAIVENMIGKGCIAISATGLKSFYALTELYQLTLAKGDKAGKTLLKDVKIAGRTYSGLANGFIPSFMSEWEKLPEENRTEEEFRGRLNEYLTEQLWASDAANNMSAFLGLSTDNAKELILAKINADTNTMGMYLYGLAIGVPVDTLYEIMTSELMFRVSELMKGDIFNNDTGLFNVLDVLRYLHAEPDQQLEKFDIFTIDAKGYTKPSEYINDAINRKILRDRLNKPASETPLQDILKATYDDKTLTLDEITSTVRSIRAEGIAEYNRTILDSAAREVVIAKFNQAMDYVMQYLADAALSRINIVKKTPFGVSNLYNDIDKLAMGADEMKSIGKILRANQEAKTNPLELIEQVGNIQQCIVRRIKRIKAYNRRHTVNDRIEIDDDMTKKGYEQRYLVDIERFFKDESYARGKILQYDKVMQSFNPLRIIHDVPHYRSYWEAILFSEGGAERLAIKQRVLANKATSFVEAMNIQDPKLKEDVSRNAENALDTFFRREWMLSQNYVFTLPASEDDNEVHIFIDNTHSARLNEVPRQIILGTPLGDANFKMWMERNIIPELKTWPALADNKFILDLSPRLNTRTQLGVVSRQYTLPIDMLPDKGDDYGQDMLREYKEHFGKLNKYTYSVAFGKNIPLPDLFYLYSLISNNGRVGRYSLHGALSDIDSDIVKSYRHYIAELDNKLTDVESKEYERMLSVLTDEVLAPTSSPFRGGSDIFKYKEKGKDYVTLYKKIVKSRGGSNMDEEIELQIAEEAMGNDGYMDQQDSYGRYKAANDQKKMLQASDFNYFTFPEQIALGEQYAFKDGRLTFSTSEGRDGGKTYKVVDLAFNIRDRVKAKLQKSLKEGEKLTDKQIDAEVERYENICKAAIKEAYGNTIPSVKITEVQTVDGEKVKVEKIVPDLDAIPKLINSKINCS